jgi:hypothetical protein
MEKCSGMPRPDYHSRYYRQTDYSTEAKATKIPDHQAGETRAREKEKKRKASEERGDDLQQRADP